MVLTASLNVKGVAGAGGLPMPRSVRFSPAAPNRLVGAGAAGLLPKLKKPSDPCAEGAGLGGESGWAMMLGCVARGDLRRSIPRVRASGPSGGCVNLGLTGCNVDDGAVDDGAA